MSPEAITAEALRLEALGYDSVWLPDLFGRDVFVLAGFLLAHTTRLRVASGIAHVYARDAMATAQGARALAELYGGRFILGLGVSHSRAAELRGHRWIPPVRKMRAYLEGLAAARVRSPAPARPAPVYIAAHGPKLLALAAELADGANTYLMPPEHTRQAREILGPEKDLNVVMPCCLCTDVDRARAVGRRALHVYLGLPAYRRRWRKLGFGDDDFETGSDRLVDSLVAWGDETAIRERIASHRDAGASHVQILPYNAEPEGTLPWKLLEALAPGPR
jgi:probable F420-dependent oxidoreductase